MRAFDKLKEAMEFLQRYCIEDAGREVEIILIHCLETDRTIFFRDNPIISKDEHKKIEEFLRRRSEREPIQYILGYVDFYGLKIKIGKGVLIPRPETEFLVEEAIKIVRSQQINPPLPPNNPPTPPLLKGGEGGFEIGGRREITNSSLVTRHSSLSVLDLCTGSGCLALAIAREFPDVQVYGTDISEVAIRYAKENAAINRINNVIFLQGNLFEPIAQLVARYTLHVTFNLIVSNPPYIKRGDIKNLQPEIKNWEPVEALDGGEDGLDFYRFIIPQARGHLKERGCLILEIGAGQAKAVRRMAEDAGFRDVSLREDYAGIERIIVAIWDSG